jgi:hypothetical protein
MEFVAKDSLIHTQSAKVEIKYKDYMEATITMFYFFL